MNLEEQYHAEEMLLKIERVEAERDNAWTELREIRAAISANPEESTLDEVVKLRQQLAAKDDEIQKLVTSDNKVIVDLSRYVETLEQKIADRDEQISDLTISSDTYFAERNSARDVWRRASKDRDELRQQLAAETMRLEIALRIKTEEHKCCSEDLMKLRESEQSGWKEAAIAWEVCRSIHEAFAKKKDALYSTRHSDFERHAEDARRMLSTKSKEKVE